MEHQLDMEHRLTETEQRSKSNTKRLDKLEETTEAINRIAISVEKIAIKQDNMSDSMHTLTGKVAALEAEPAKRWKFVVEKAIYFIVAAVLGYFLAAIGL